MKYLILENDEKLSSDLTNYLLDKPHEIIFSADGENLDEMIAKFSTLDVLLFEPTLITWSQYNHALMLLYKLINEGVCTIKEIQIFHKYDTDTYTKTLKNLWSGKSKYLQVVLAKIRVFKVGRDFTEDITDKII